MHRLPIWNSSLLRGVFIGLVNTTCSHHTFKLDQYENKKFQGDITIHLVKCLPFKGITITRSCPTILTQETLVGLIIKIISSIESFFLSIIVSEMLTENCKRKHHCSPFKGNNSDKESSDIHTNKNKRTKQNKTKPSK